MTKRFLLPFLAILGVASAWAQVGGKTVLFDFRVDRYPVPAKIPPAVEKKVLDALFPKYFKSQSECDAATNVPADLEQKRKLGLMVPTLTTAVVGSFTAAGLNQNAYIIQVRECFASHAEDFGSKRIAIFSGESLVANLEIGLDNYIASVKLAGGLTGLLLSGGWSGQGVIQTNATVYGFAGGKLNDIRTFGTVVSSNCEVPSNPNRKMQATVISVRETAAGPEFSQDFYQAKCPAGSSHPAYQPFPGPVESY